MSFVRTASIVVIALAVGVQVVRNGIVTAAADTSPQRAAKAWGGHPDAELGVAMTDIATAARQGRPVAGGVFAMVNDAARKAPLAPEPFLVRGVQAQLAGNAPLAGRAFQAAEWRDPRSLPARYFLADHYLRAGDVRRGLTEFAALARLAPGGIGSATPYVASYARDASRWAQIRALFRSDPDLAEATLEALAHDGANTAAILALADPAHRNARSPWLPVLLEALVSRGDYQRARSIWADVARVPGSAGQMLFDADFADPGPPPPFNWTLTSSTVGLAERQGGGRLHVIYYGQEEGPLADQLLVLGPGRYALSMRVEGGGDRLGALRWTLTCANAQAPFAEVGLDAISRQPWTFDVPSGCGAQRLDFTGSSSDIPQQVDVTLTNVSLRQVKAGA